MKLYNFLFPVIIILFLVLLLAFPSVCFSGAKAGLILWFETVVPVLFPFFIVTHLMNHFKITDCINLVLAPLVKRVFKVSPAGAFPVLLGFISGFPLGAKACAQEVRQGRIGLREGQYILSFCNNVSPAFLTGYLTLNILGKKGFLPAALIYASALLCALTYRLCPSFKYKEDMSLMHKAPDVCKRSLNFHYFIKIFDDVLVSAAEILIKIGGYIIIFSILQKIILTAALNIPGDFPVLRFFLVLSAANMEVTSGISILNGYLANHPLILPFFSPDAIKTALILMTASFGGLSAMAQTKSVIMGSGLSLKKYFITRIINAAYAAILSLIVFS